MGMLRKAASAPKAVIEQKVRDWRLVKMTYDELKPTIVEGKKLEEEERGLRAAVGEAFGCAKGSITVDGATVIYERSQRENGFDYQGAWNELQLTAPPALQKKMAELLHAKPPVVIHKLSTE